MFINLSRVGNSVLVFLASFIIEGKKRLKEPYVGKILEDKIR